MKSFGPDAKPSLPRNGQPEEAPRLTMSARPDKKSASGGYDVMVACQLPKHSRSAAMTVHDNNPRAPKDILADVKRLAVEYYAATGKPFGASGELAEFEAAEKLGLELADGRTAGFDAVRCVDGKMVRIQVKGRRTAPGKSRYRGRVPKINLKQPFDAVVLVLMDEDYEAVEIWEASREAVSARLGVPGSKSRNEKGSMGIPQFKSIARRVWPSAECITSAQRR